VGEFFGVSYATVSRAVEQAEKGTVNVKCKADPNQLSSRIYFPLSKKNGAFLLKIIYPLKFLIKLTMTITAVKKSSSQLVWFLSFWRV